MKISLKNLNKPRPSWARNLERACTTTGLLISGSAIYNKVDWLAYVALGLIAAGNFVSQLFAEESATIEVDPTKDQTVE